MNSFKLYLIKVLVHAPKSSTRERQTSIKNHFYLLLLCISRGFIEKKKKEHRKFMKTS